MNDEENKLTPIDSALVFTAGMGIESNADKDQINRHKHGYALASVEDWVSRTLLPINGTAPPTVWLEQLGRAEDEPRYRMLSVDWEGHVVDFVFTMREDEHGRVLRIITYHRADEPKCALFWQHWEKDEVSAWLKVAYPPRNDQRSAGDSSDTL